jgi:amino acid adenylation domain-containing protein
MEYTGLEIAVIGMAGRFPGGRNLEDYWNNIKNGVESVLFFTDEQLVEAGTDGEMMAHPDFVSSMGYLEGIEDFDASFFEYTPVEAELMDPQIRLMHETAWEALEDAGYVPENVEGLIGLYGGASESFYWKSLALLAGKTERLGQFESDRLTGRDYVCSRVAYKLDLKGPVLFVHTACSTSMVAIHAACQGLIGGESDMALAGGVSIIPYIGGYIYQEGMIQSPDGHCRTFDDRARGTVAGNGVGLVVLKRLEDALEDNDHIYAIIKGTAINNDGIQKIGFTAPSVEGQSEVIREALQNAQVEPETIGYVEAHGTGTTLGDPIEVEALALAYETGKKGFAGIGSVKTNIGHLDAAAGVAGFIKTVQAVYHKQIPPTINFETPNRNIDFLESPFYVSTELRDWNRGDTPRRAGVSSLGLGGTNVHMILEEAPGEGERRPEAAGKRLMVLSARTKEALERQKENLAEYLRTHPQARLADVAFTLQVGRRAFKHRWIGQCETVEEAVSLLSTGGAGEYGTVSEEPEHPAGTIGDIFEAGDRWLSGAGIDWREFYRDSGRRRLPLPTYPFERKRYWIEGNPLKMGLERFRGMASIEKKENMAEWFYVPSWKRSRRLTQIETTLETTLETGAGTRNDVVWMVFLDRTGFGGRVVEVLQKMSRDVVTVQPGQRFGKMGETENPGKAATAHYRIDPRQAADYRRLYRELEHTGKIPLRILHLWSLGEEQGEENDSFDEQQYMGYFSLIYLANAMETVNIKEDVQLGIVTSGIQDVTGSEPLVPEKATVMGPVKVIPQEFPYIVTRSIDILPLEPGSRGESELARHIVAELETDVPEPAAAYRGNYRWVQTYEPRRLGIPRSPNPRLKQRGVYLVTGGNGKIGNTVAKYLARTLQARLLLVGRSPMAEEKCRELETLGAEVLFQQADVGSVADMERAVAAAEERFGGIDGFFHAAGETGDSIIRAVAQVTEESTRQQFQARVHGLAALETVFHDKPMDFGVVVSSLVSVLGGLGFAAYGGAVITMDTRVQAHNRRHPVPWISVNTAEWLFGDIDRRDDSVAAETIELSMSADEGLETFERILSHFGESQVVISTGDLQPRVDKWVKLQFLREESENERSESRVNNRPELPTPYEAPAEPLQEKMAAIWEHFFGIYPIGIHDDFFQLGGDSLKVITLLSRMHKEFDVKLSIEEFFGTPRISDLAARIQRGERGSDEGFRDIEPVEEQEYYPLSSAQQRMYFLQQMDESGTSYNIPFGYAVGPEMEPYRVEELFKKLIRRHESLRTSFHMVDNVPVQKVHKPEEVPFSVEAYENGDETEIREIITGFVRPFDLEKPPLLRVLLLTLPCGNRIWVMDVHHIVADGTSQTIMVENFLKYFHGEEPEPLDLHIQYKEFARWQNRLLETGGIKEQEEYWLDLYRDSASLPRLNLPTDYQRPELFTFKGNLHRFMLEREDVEQFKRLGQRNGGTLYMNIMTALNTLFFKYTGQTDIIIGSGIAGRRHVRLQPVTGMFVNSLAMRNKPAAEKTYGEFLKEVIANSIRGFENQDVQFEDLVDKLQLERDAARNPLFDVLMVVQNFPRVEDGENSVMPPFVEEDKLSRKVDFRFTTSKFDLVFFINEIGDDVSVLLEYYTGIFKEETILRIERHFKTIIKSVIKEPGTRLKDIDIMTEDERRRVLETFNETARPFPEQQTVHGIFEAQVRKTPDAVAVVGRELGIAGNNGGTAPVATVTYRELNDRAQRLAAYLCIHGRNLRDAPVGLMMDRSIDMITAILGILKSGAAYVPIGTTFPLARIADMLDDTACEIVISERKYINRLNRLQWDCPAFHTFLCMDSHDVYAEEEVEKSQLMSKKLWEFVGDRAVDDVTGGGWNSSYTGDPIPGEEMDEYGDNILKKLKPVLHDEMKILEIGCASGITMYRIAPEVKLYYGTDLSSVIIEKNRRRAAEEGHDNIRLESLPAHEIDKIPEKDFDLVIVNSVIQCFHGHNYLRGIIRKIVELLAPKGMIFIGDIMDQDLKRRMVKDLEEFKREHRGKGYTTKTDWSVELFISRRFLEDQVVENPAIRSMEFSRKIYTLENELTRYRYDALLHVDKTGIAASETDTRSKHKNQHDRRALPSPVQVSEARFPEVDGHNMAYIIYTSGTTGRPKGTVTTHRNAIRVVRNTDYIDIAAQDRILQLSNYAFDGSVFDINGALLNGAALVMAQTEDVGAVDLLASMIRRQGITVFFVTTALFNVLVEQEIECFNGIRRVLFGGERVSVEHARKALAWMGPGTIKHVYGPTETTVYATCYHIDTVEDRAFTIPIGKPIANTEIYIVDAHMNIVPPGICGEIYIGGEGTARGYLNNPGLTAERFLKKSSVGRCWALESKEASELTNDYLYKTGDLARWLPDGNVEFRGRVDQQVKIRGFRIELGEIEAQLLRHDNVAEAVAVTRRDTGSGRYICAYIVSDEKIEPSELKENLGLTLPDFMIPAHILQLEKLPLNPSGKVDVKALPGPELSVGEEYVAPRTAIEKKLAQIWSEVLQVQCAVGLDDNFFQLGGHSLKATVLTSKLHKEMGVRMPLAEVFVRQTLREMAEYIAGAGKEKYIGIRPVEEKEYYPLSSAQKRMYILQQMEPGSISYNIPMVMPLEKAVDPERLETILKRLIHRHESLRTSFPEVNGEPVQRVWETGNVTFEVEVFDCSNESAGEVTETNTGTNTDTNTDTDNIIHRFIRPFDLTAAPLMRSGLIKLARERYIWMVDVHHIVSDGTSQTVIAEDFLALYNKEPLEPETLRVQYKDFALWQNRLKESGQLAEMESYWQKQLADAAEIPRLQLPADYKRPANYTFAGANISFMLDRSDSRKFKAQAAAHGGTLYMNTLAALNALFYKYTGQEDIVIGSGIAGRPHADLQRIVGMFINTLIMRHEVQGEMTYDALLKQVVRHSVDAFENQDFQFEELVEKLDLPRDPSRNPLFDVSMVVQNFRRLDEATAMQESGQNRRLPVTDVNPADWGVDYKNTVAKFDLTFYVQEMEDDIYVDIEYYTGVFSEATLQRMAGHFRRLIHCVANHPAVPIKNIDILSEAEKNQLLLEFNDVPDGIRVNKTLHAHFIDQVEQRPDAVAVAGPSYFVDADGNGEHYVEPSRHVTVTFRELNRLTDKLAKGLTAEVIGPSGIVGLKVRRSVEMVVGMFGILKAGAAYMPIDPANPPERTEYMIRDSSVLTVLTEQGITGFLSRTLSENDNRRALPEISDDAPAYTIYTSGTTGRPKGTLVTHRNLVRLVKNPDFIEIGASDRVLQMLNYAFDGSVFDFYGSLLNGAPVVLVEPEAAGSPESLADIMHREQITVSVTTTAMFNALVDVKIDGYKNVRKILVGGESLSVEHIRKALEYLGKNRLLNVYGPTEATVFTSIYGIDRISTDAASIPIGGPAPGTAVYILDHHHCPVPMLAPGEIYVGGNAVALGYLNNPELTAEKFIADSSLQPTLIYKTGDLGRWLPGGIIEFLGRSDHQVKIRGFRIELEEIEARLRSHRRIGEAVVTVYHGSGDKYLCAYVTVSDAAAGELDITELKTDLQQSLPEYMIPQYVIPLERFPMTRNGKLDRNALPAPEMTAAEIYTAPRDDTEKRLTDIWDDVLDHRNPIGIDDNFFQLGGHSLKATRMSSKIYQTFGCKIPLAEVFKAQTVRKLSDIIRRSTGESGYEAIEPVPSADTYELSFNQNRLWILHQRNPGDNSYNIPDINVMEHAVDEAAVRRTLERLVERHESLRTGFGEQDGRALQFILDEDDERCRNRLETVDLSSLDSPDETLRLQEIKRIVGDFNTRPFHLEQPPLFRALLLKIAEEKFMFAFNMHHIISDGWSMRILTGEFRQFYEAERNGGGLRLEPPVITYKDFAHWHNSQLERTGVKENSRRFWIEFLQEPLPELRLPCDFGTENLESGKTNAYFKFFIHRSHKDALKQLGKTRNITMFALMYAVYNIFLSSLTGQKYILTGIVNAGRDHPALHGVVGFFVNSVLFKVEIDGEKNFIDFAADVQERMLEVFSHQDYPLEMVLDEVGKTYPEIGASFNMLNVLENESVGYEPPETLLQQDYRVQDAKFDIEPYVLEYSDSVEFNVSYNTRRFKAENMAFMMTRYKKMIEYFARNPYALLNRYKAEYMNEKEDEKENEKENGSVTDSEKKPGKKRRSFRRKS